MKVFPISRFQPVSICHALAISYAISGMAVAASLLAPPPMPESVIADTEVETNIVFDAGDPMDDETDHCIGIEWTRGGSLDLRDYLDSSSASMSSEFNIAAKTISGRLPKPYDHILLSPDGKAALKPTSGTASLWLVPERCASKPCSLTGTLRLRLMPLSRRTSVVHAYSKGKTSMNTSVSDPFSHLEHSLEISHEQIPYDHIHFPFPCIDVLPGHRHIGNQCCHACF